MKDECYKEIAIVKQDLSICDKIQSQDEKDSCYMHFTLNR